MELRLYHGRKDPEQDMEENGFWYPVIPGVVRISVTYLNLLRVEFETAQIAQQVCKATKWEVWDEKVLGITMHYDMLKAVNGAGEVCYFGDWDIAPDGTFAAHPAGYLVEAAKPPYVGEPFVRGGYVVCHVIDSEGRHLHTETRHPGYTPDNLEVTKTATRARCEGWLAGFNSLKSKLQHLLKS